MRRALAVLWGVAAAVSSTIAAAQQPQPIPQPQPLPVPPPAPPAAPPATEPAAQPEPAPAPGAQPAPAARPETPPPPPAPGSASLAPEPPPAAPAAFAAAPPDSPASDKGAPLAGYHGDFYIRNAEDWIRIYPKGRVQIDFNSYFGPGVHDITAADGGNALKTRLFLRRAEFEVGGEMFKRWSFNIGAEVTASLGNATGKAQTSASSAGEDPTAETARFQGVQTPAGGIAPADNFINYSACKCFNVLIGQLQAPFGIENRTGNKTTPFMERNIAIRGFAFPSSKEMGLTLWGETDKRVINYEIGVFDGDGQNRFQVDSRADFLGRVFVRPFGGQKGHVIEKAQIGVSAKHGDRDPEYLGYDYPSINSGQGFALWRPEYRDSLGRRIHVIPSGSQNAIGGELRVPISKVALQGEAYYVANRTREAVEGYQLTNTERLGAMTGVGWYVQLSAWPLGDAFVQGDPGFARPTHVDLDKEAEKPKRGLELLAIVSAVNAHYAGASRGGVADGKTPDGDIDIFSYGAGLSYWHTKHLRLSINYIAYHTPGSASEENLAGVPGNQAKVGESKEAHLLHELGARTAVFF